MYRMTEEEFENMVAEALDSIPEQFLEALENLAVVVEDEPSDYHLAMVDAPDPLGEDELLGLYDGVPLTERNPLFDDDAPDVIVLFKGPHERSFDTREEMLEEVRKTIIHEIGHYFGLDDSRLHEMGY